MILVTGATGKFGSKAIGHLLNNGVNASDIAALIRDAAKAQNLKDKGVELRIGDYADYDSLVNAFQNIDKLLLISSNDKKIENRTAQHINAIKAAKTAGVKHIVYTSFLRQPKFEDSAIALFQDSHVKTEQFLKGARSDYPRLRFFWSV